MTEAQNYTEVAVAIGRVEEGLKFILQRLDRMDEAFDSFKDNDRAQDRRLADLETTVETIKSEIDLGRKPRLHPITIGSGIGAILAIALVVFDRLFASAG